MHEFNLTRKIIDLVLKTIVGHCAPYDIIKYGIVLCIADNK